MGTGEQVRRERPEEPGSPSRGPARGAGGALAFAPDEVDLVGLDRAVHDAIRSGDVGSLPVVGYGEISLAVAWPPTQPTVVAKSLPPFDDPARYGAYVDLLDEYLATLETREVLPLPTAVRAVPEGRRRRAYVLQPCVPADAVGSALLAAADREAGTDLLRGIVAAVLRASDDVVGIDGQVSNWAVVDGELRFLDVSTPMLRDGGHDRLDTALFAEMVPWVTRWVVRRFVAPELLSPYHDPRRVVLDTAGNLVRERLTGWIPVLLEVANPHLDPPLTVGEVRRFYRGNARTWSAIQTLRRVDRGWQRHVRGREYPFLLPASYRR
jgi:hypothetical protein